MKTCGRRFSLAPSTLPLHSLDKPHPFFTFCVRGGGAHEKLVYGVNLPYGHEHLRTPSSYSTPLHMSIIGLDDAEIIKELLDNGARVIQPNLYGETPLHYAAQKGNPQVIDLLLKRKADPTHKGNGKISLVY